jgi:phytoene dehydrogenase-like protein
MDDDIDIPTAITGSARSDVIVIGAGIAGLSAAVTVAATGATVTVLDAHPGGGRARTDERDGFLHNTGPHALYLGGHLHDLLRRHGLDLPGRSPDTTRLDLWWDGAVTRLDLTPVGLARTPLFGRRSRMRMLALFGLMPRRRPGPLVGRTVADWLADEPADVGAFVRSIVRLSTYGDADDELDAGAAVAQLRIAFAGVRYLDGGWARIVDGLTARARRLGAIVRTDLAVTGAETDGTACVVHTASGSFRATNVVIAAGGPDVAERLTGAPVAGRARLTGSVGASTLDLALTRVHEGVQLGVDEPLYLSPHAPLAALAPTGRGLVGVMRYLAPGTSAGDPAQRREELRAFARLAGIDDTDIVHERYLHQSVVTHGLPAARGGGLAGRPAVDALGMPGVFLAGDWVGSTGFLADASAASGEAAGRLAADRCARIAA